jgi:hypothetical protein
LYTWLHPEYFLFIVAVKANLGTLQGFAQQFRISGAVVDIVAGGTLDIAVEKGEYRNQPHRVQLVASAAAPIDIGLMLPQYTHRMIVRKIDAKVMIPGDIIGADVARKTLQGHRTVMTGKA